MTAGTAEKAPDETAPEPAEQWPPTRHLTVDEAMVAVMREIGGVGKNGWNKAHEYHFRAQEDIVAAVRVPMAKYGLRMLPRVIEQQHFLRGRSNVAILTMEYVVRGPGGDVMEPSIIVVGEGADVSDKASNKAMTAAKKYALVQAFEIASENVADGDRESPESLATPLDPYVEELMKRSVWCDRGALGVLRQRAMENGHAHLVMQDGSGRTLLQTIEARGDELLAQQRDAEQKQRAAGEAASGDQPRADQPEYHRSSPDGDVWDRPPANSPKRPQPAPAPEQNLPDPQEIEGRLADAVKDPATAVKALNDIRKHYTPAVLKMVQVPTQWGQVDGNSAITFALREVAQQGARPAPAARPAVEAPPRAPEPEPEPEEAPQAPERPEAVQPEPEAAAAAEKEPEKPTWPPVREFAPAPDGQSKTERARWLLDREAEFQAQVLGMLTLEYVADLLPAGATGIEDIPGNVKLQNLIVENRPRVVAALIGAGMKRQAEEYAALGERAPARNIEAIIRSALSLQSSL
jgi:hypothetical protein